MSENKYEVPAVRKAIALIELLSKSHEAMGVSEISQALDINKHMVMRMLHTLEDLNWIEKENSQSKYSLSLQPFYHTSKVVNRMDLKLASKEPMHELWKETGETTYLVICEKEKALIIDILDSTRNVKISGVLGGSYFLHTTAPGKVLLAFGDKQLLANSLERGLQKVTDKSITDGAQLSKELVSVKENGFATDNMESNDGGLCLAVPIYNYENKVVGSIGQTVISLYYNMDEVVEILAPKIIETGKKISEILGYTGYQNENRYELTLTN